MLDAGRLLLAGTGAESTRATLRMTRAVAAEGADAVLVQYRPPTAPGVYVTPGLGSILPFDLAVPPFFLDSVSAIRPPPPLALTDARYAADLEAHYGDPAGGYFLVGGATASFVDAPTIAVDVSGTTDLFQTNNGGTVNRNPNLASYPADSVVTLTAQPVPGRTDPVSRSAAANASL